MSTRLIQTDSRESNSMLYLWSLYYPNRQTSTHLEYALILHWQDQQHKHHIDVYDLTESNLLLAALTKHSFEDEQHHSIQGNYRLHSCYSLNTASLNLDSLHQVFLWCRDVDSDRQPTFLLESVRTPKLQITTKTMPVIFERIYASVQFETSPEDADLDYDKWTLNELLEELDDLYNTQNHLHDSECLIQRHTQKSDFSNVDLNPKTQEWIQQQIAEQLQPLLQRLASIEAKGSMIDTELVEHLEKIVKPLSVVSMTNLGLTTKDRQVFSQTYHDWQKTHPIHRKAHFSEQLSTSLANKIKQAQLEIQFWRKGQGLNLYQIDTAPPTDTKGVSLADRQGRGLFYCIYNTDSLSSWTPNAWYTVIIKEGQIFDQQLIEES